ncbi:phenylacetate-CoA ligase [Methylomarinovum caldicuralii]|uniref:Phenylacetate-CoA ligase n=1 Tax=Methylomarinovum caldicuralii TaxID=438856 RepID=A0AAU9C0C1_9GAMM|nr:AMP-binding protein [Methylomarinovum caldicuralii]BCX82105.1 phenylacetate-CoA ligase [Methylomarinovum caldicuralii]
MVSLPPPLSRTLYRLQEQALKRPTFAYLGDLEHNQWLAREELESLQLQKLRALLAICLAHCPWHARRIRNSGIDPENLTWEDFRRLPTMTREDASRHGDEMVWREAPGGIYRYNTGGSSGEPLIFYFGRKRQAADAACRIRARRWWGVEPGDREVLLWGAPVELNRTDRLKTLRDRLCNQLLLNAFEMSEARMDAYLDQVEAYQPKVIYGYASSLALLAEHAEKRNRVPHLPQLKVVYATGEPLYPHQKEIIARVFAAPVAREYGARDAGLIALESPAGQLLVNSEWLIVEILDDKGNPVPDGESGEVVITNLASEAQPFIRYRTGDRARRSATPCRQGRGLEVLEEVEGRSTDFIVSPDGTVMHALALIYILREIPGVRRFKIIQQRPTQVEVLIVPEPDLWQDANLDTIRRGLRQRLGQEVAINIDLVGHIPAEKSGKYRYVVSEIQGTPHVETNR